MKRRTKSEVDLIRVEIFAALELDHPQTVRQVFYQLVSAGVIEKTESEYKHTVGRLLAELRLNGSIPFEWVADNTRWQRKPRTFNSWKDALDRTAQTYRRALMEDQAVYCEVWLEKDALASVLYQETSRYDVPLMVNRGYASLSYLYEAAQTIKSAKRPTRIFYFGDYDPSGLDISRVTEKRLREFAPEADIAFERVAVTHDQIESLNLPTRPTKTTDIRARGFVGGSVEVDAIPASSLLELCRTSIESVIDRDLLQRSLAIEKEERLTLDTLLRQVSSS